MSLYMNSIPAKFSTDDVQKKIIEDFHILGSWDERYQYLIDLGRRLNRDSNVPQCEENRLYGCQANVWLTAECQNGIVRFKGNSDSLIVSGLMAVILKVFSNRPAEEVITLQPDFIVQTGLIDHLSSQRSTGLMSMIQQIREYAASCLAASKDNA